MLAEDENLIALFLRRYLVALGAEVKVISRVEHGLWLDHGAFDHAMLDVSLADGEVFPLAERLRDAGIPIIFHTGHGASLRELSDYGDAIALTKPAHTAEILAAILSQITSRQLSERKYG